MIAVLRSFFLVKTEEMEENWSKSDKREFIEQLLEERSNYENMSELISFGHKALLEFESSYTSACYLYGCKRQNHPEY